MITIITLNSFTKFRNLYSLKQCIFHSDRARCEGRCGEDTGKTRSIIFAYLGVSSSVQVRVVARRTMASAGKQKMTWSCTKYVAVISGVSHVRFLAKFKNFHFWQFLKISNFHFVMFWLGIWCESLVWVIMGRWAVSQNEGVLVVLVSYDLWYMSYTGICLVSIWLEVLKISIWDIPRNSFCLWHSFANVIGICLSLFCVFGITVFRGDDNWLQKWDLR